MEEFTNEQLIEILKANPESELRCVVSAVLTKRIKTSEWEIRKWNF